MKRCMFVDDSAVIRKVAKRILGGPDMQFIEASTGFDAISMCIGDMPDIIVVDGALPDMTAVEFIRRVRGIDSPVKPQIAICLTEVDIARDHARQARRRSRVSAETLQPAAVARPLPAPAERGLKQKIINDFKA